MKPTREAVEALWPVIWRIAGSMARRSRGYWSQEELASFGYTGAVGGLRTYDPAFGHSLEDHCARRIKGAMLDHMAIKGWHFLPRGPKEALRRATEPDATTRPVDEEDAVDGLLRCLPARHEWMVRCYYVHGWTMAEIGRALGICESSVSQYLRRARRYVRDAHGQN